MSMKFDDEKTEAYHWRMNTETRIEKLEADDISHKADFAFLKANCATKSDIAKLEAQFVELKAETKVLVAEAKVSIITWTVTSIFLAQLLPALLKLFLPS